MCASFPFCVTFCILRQLFGAPFFKKQIINTTKPTFPCATFFSFSLFSPSPLQPGSSRCSVVFRSGSTLQKIAEAFPSSLTGAARPRGASLRFFAVHFSTEKLVNVIFKFFSSKIKYDRNWVIERFLCYPSCCLGGLLSNNEIFSKILIFCSAFLYWKLCAPLKKQAAETKVCLRR